MRILKKREIRKAFSVIACLIVSPLLAQAAPPSPQEVLEQKRPDSWPESVDVEMDESILSDDARKKAFVESLSLAPSLMLDLSVEDLFGKEGIYKDAKVGEEIPEVLVMASYWPSPTQRGFQIRCGIRPQGRGSLAQSPKRNFRLRFAKEFGAGELAYPLFSEKVEKFENLLVRSPTHDSWTVKWTHLRKNPRYVNDRWALETARELGHISPRQRWVHVYLNQIYWGLYALSERPDEHFAATHLGRKAEDLDFFNAGELREGSDKQRKMAEDFLAEEFENTEESFKKLEGFLNIGSLIDHLTCQIYQGKSDWPKKNYFLIGSRKGTARFAFGSWDSEVGFYEEKLRLGADAENALYYAPLSTVRFLSDRSGPGFWYRHLRASEEFRLMFADRVHFLMGKMGHFIQKRPRRVIELC